MTAPFPVGVAFFPPPVSNVLASIKRAEQAGLRMAWIPSWPVGPDGMSIVMAAAAQTNRIGLGTGIALTYPCHPLTRVNEALVLAELAPQRFRLGIGASHQPAIEGHYGLPFEKPLTHIREYVAVLRGLLWEGHIDLDGGYYRVHATLPPTMAPPRFPIVLAALRRNMLRLAGEISDGAMLIWAPLSYVHSVALPALEEGARLAHRSRPPLIVSAPILLTQDFALVSKVAQAAFAVYASFPSYGKMFNDAGYPLTDDGQLTDALIHELFIYGDEETIRRRLFALQAAGVDELVTVVRPLSDPLREETIIFEILATL